MEKHIAFLKKNIIIIIIFFEVKSSFAWLGNS